MTPKSGPRIFKVRSPSLGARTKGHPDLFA